MLAHACDQCGHDLSSLRAAREPIYQLSVVRCPHCERVYVRRKDPFRTLLDHTLRLDAALWRLVLHMCIAASLGGGVVGGMWLASLAAHAPPSPFFHLPSAVAVLGFFFAGLPVVLGTWLTAGFAHVKRWRAWAGWSALMVGIWFITLMFSWIFSGEIDFISHSDRAAVRDAWLAALLALGYLGWVMLFALAGVPLGLMLRRFTAGFQRRRWWLRWRMRRRRWQRS